MNRFIVVLVGLFCAIATNAVAADWIMYNVDEKTNNTYWLDRSSLHMVENRNALFDIKVEFGNSTIKTVVWTERADCVSKKHKAEKETIYYRDGKVEGPGTPGDYRATWSDTPKDSVPELICTGLFGEIN